MRSYITQAVITLPEGTVMQLSDAQAAARRYALAPVGKNTWRATASVQFKAGEELGLEVDPPKQMAQELVDEKEVARRTKSADAQRKRAEAAAHAEAVVSARAELLDKLPAELRAQVEKALAGPAPGANG